VRLKDFFFLENRFDELRNIVLTNVRANLQSCASHVSRTRGCIFRRTKNHVNIPIFMRLFPSALVEDVHIFCAYTE